MKKKILTSVLAVSMLVSSYTTAFAADDVISATQIGSQAATVTYKDASTFNVTIPKSIHIGSDKIGTYEVKVTGELNDGDVLNVVPSKTVEMTDAEGKASVTAKVGQKKTDFEKEDLADGAEVTTTGTVRSDELSAGAWTGNLSFDIGIETLGTIGEDIELTSNNLSTYGIASTGDVTIPKWVQDTDGVYHKVTSIKSATFQKNKDITSIVIPDSIKKIESFTFNWATNLSNIDLPCSIESIGKRAFYNCNLANIDLPDNITTIESDAFADNKLTSIQLPESLEKLGESAFGYNRINSDIYIPKNLTTLMDDDGSLSLSYIVNPFRENSPTRIIVDPENTVFDSRNNCNALIKTDENILIAASEATIIPLDVVELHNYSFSGLNIKTINIPSNITKIKAGAFSHSNIETITIPSSVTKIDSFTFDHCKSLQTVILPDTLKEIGMEAFASSSIKTISLPSKLTTIRTKAFYLSNLTGTLTIPDSVTSIGENAFQYTSSNLHLKYNGSATGAPWGCDNAVNK